MSRRFKLLLVLLFIGSQTSHGGWLDGVQKGFDWAKDKAKKGADWTADKAKEGAHSVRKVIRPINPLDKATCPELSKLNFNWVLPHEIDPPPHYENPCQKGEECVTVDVNQFTMFMEGYNDRYRNHDYMNIRSYWNPELERWDLGPQMKGDKKHRYQEPPYRTMAQHPVVINGAYLFVCQIFTDHIEFYGMEYPMVMRKDEYSWRIHITFKKELTPEEVKRAFIYNGYIFIEKDRVFDIENMLRDEVLDSVKIKGEDRPGRATMLFNEEKTFNDIVGEKISSDLVKGIEKFCFNGENKSCTIDVMGGYITPVDYTGVVFTIKDLVVQARWVKQYCDYLPEFFIRHLHFPPNKVLQFGRVADLQTHTQHLEWVQSIKAMKDPHYTYIRNMIMPIIQPNDPIHEFANKFTTPAPKDATATTKNFKNFTMRPIQAITRNPNDTDNDVIEYVVEDDETSTADPDYVLEDLTEDPLDASYDLMVPLANIWLGFMLLWG
ncbi:unnamed protein product [Bursaphelenchus okinawaensis]|uniref:Uncharacterized protein n=1 Tax=Bursaphelenchus okinawaensis TaxID=465554 RepID=A0A811KDX2_9BILA|nr:unnamed protein product [Bursaphelenchus okinawaensis]CAG9101913.1 unnamed protein product [Bursaphelenchus okinawaensis]